MFTMKGNATKRGVSIILAAAMLLMLFQTVVLAADNETVLTSVSHSAAISTVNVTGAASATLTVPYNYSGNVDLANGLSIAYNTSVYASAVASFLSGSVAVPGGNPVTMTVTYQKVNDPAVYTTNYAVSVVKASSVAPVFSGTVAKTLTAPGSVSLTASDFSPKYTKNDGGDLAYIAITGSNPAFGAIKLGGQNYNFGDLISLSNLSGNSLTFAATGAGTVSYVVRAYAQGDTAAPIGSVTLTVTAETVKTAGTVSYTTAKNTPVTLRSIDFAGAFSTGTGETLGFVQFTLPSASAGKLYYNYRSASDYDSIVFSGSEYFNNAAPDISNVTFVPAQNYTGTVTIDYTAYNANTISPDFAGKLQITVNNTGTNPGTTPDVITYEAQQGKTVSFSASDFEEVSQALTGKGLSYVKFVLPETDLGKLYYNYRSSGNYDALVFADTAYNKASAPKISDVDFVPAADVTGDIIINYTAFNTDGASFTGQIKITVEEEDDDDNGGWNGGWGSGGWQNPFVDVGPQYSWAQSAIQYLYLNNIIMGQGSGYYNPNAYVTRGDFILMLSRAFNLNCGFSGNFYDVNPNSYYYNAVGMARAMNIVQGSGSYFNPMAPLSRQDAMVLLSRAMKAVNKKIPKGLGKKMSYYSDYNNVSDYAMEAVAELLGADIIQGSGNNLNPRGNVSRAEMAVLLQRILDR